jgi:hypothetical protein
VKPQNKGRKTFIQRINGRVRQVSSHPWPEFRRELESPARPAWNEGLCGLPCSRPVSCCDSSPMS